MLPVELVEFRLVPGVDETTRSLVLSLLLIGRRRKSAADLDMSLSAIAAVRALLGRRASATARAYVRGANYYTTAQEAIIDFQPPAPPLHSVARALPGVIRFADDQGQGIPDLNDLPWLGRGAVTSPVLSTNTCVDLLFLQSSVCVVTGGQVARM